MLLPKRMILAVGMCAVWLGASFSEASAAPATIALTMTRPADAAKEQQLAENLLTLVELAVQADTSVAIVERRQIDLVIQELVLNQSRSADAQLQLGKLITADFLVMLEILPADKDSPKPWGRLRLVDPKTGAIRGVTVASLDEATLEETAQQFSRYVSALIRAPEKPTVTVAVAPFESKGRFDRLRPLELGIRDLVTTRLLRLSGAATPGTAEAKNVKIARAPLSFQVVQRSNMEQLLRELDLIQSGLSDKSRLPATLPSRAATYLIRGEIDERQEKGHYTIVVRGEMIQAVTQRVVETFEFECPPPELEAQLARKVDRIAERLTKDEKIGAPAHVEDRFEVQSLKQLVMNDMQRIPRCHLNSNQVHAFRIEGVRNVGRTPHQIHVETPLGRHLLQIAIDRLESILFITPDDAEAAFALGYCYSIHEKDIYQPQRADEMFRKAYAIDPQARLAAFALELLASIAYDDRTGKLEAGSEEVTIERLAFAFEHTPAKWRDPFWAHLLLNQGILYTRPDQMATLAELLAKSIPIAEKSDPGWEFRPALVGAVGGLARELVRRAGDQPALKAKGMELLERWAESDDKPLAECGSGELAFLLVLQHDVLGAATVNLRSAAKLIGAETPGEYYQYNRRLVDAAKFFRQAKQPERALELLLSFESRLAEHELATARENPRQPGSPLLGLHGFEVGACYEALGEPEKAHAAYLRAVERCPSVSTYFEFLPRLNALGGVPLRKDREIDVRYLPREGEPRISATTDRGMYLVTDGRKIYVGGKQGIYVFDVAKETWESAPLKADSITSLQCSDGQLWAGTHAAGVWRCNLSSGNWTPACNPAQLPDQHIESLALAGNDVYVGVGTSVAGGLIRIDSAGQVHVFNERDAPVVAPTHIVVADKRLLARSQESLHEWSFRTKSWSRPEVQGIPPQLFPGKTAIWASIWGHELTRWDGTADQNVFFKSTWYLPENNTGYVLPAGKAGYRVYFCTEHDGEVWFGGDPFVSFLNSGLYRFNLKTGVFTKFGPSDGFSTVWWFHRIYDGLWLGDRLWLATYQGLCVVKPLK